MNITNMQHIFIVNIFGNIKTRATKVSGLIDQKKINFNHFENHLIVSVIFHENKSNICWFPLLKFKAFLLFFLIYDSK